MYTEISHASDYICYYLLTSKFYTPEEVELFKCNLRALLASKYKPCWYKENPTKGCAYRAITFFGRQPDPIVYEAAQGIGLDERYLSEIFPEELCIWCDPGGVTCRDASDFRNIKCIYNGLNTNVSNINSILLSSSNKSSLQNNNTRNNTTFTSVDTNLAFADASRDSVTEISSPISSIIEKSTAITISSPESFSKRDSKIDHSETEEEEQVEVEEQGDNLIDSIVLTTNDNGLSSTTPIVLSTKTINFQHQINNNTTNNNHNVVDRSVDSQE